MNLENAVQYMNSLECRIFNILLSLYWSPILCLENRSCGPAARRTMRWKGTLHFKLHATPQVGRRCGFQDE